MQWLADQPDHLNGKNHVISMVGCGVIEGEPYLLLPMAEKGSLASRLKVEGLTDKEYFQLSEQLFRGTAFLHHNHIIHQDLKPSNLLITDNDHLLIGDLGEVTGKQGMAAFDQNSGYSPDKVRGTTVLRPGARISENSGSHNDIWATGLTLMQMLVGKQKGDDFTDELNALPGMGKSVDKLTKEEAKHLQQQIHLLVDQYTRGEPLPIGEGVNLASAMVKVCLAKDPARRTSAENLLQILPNRIFNTSVG